MAAKEGDVLPSTGRTLSYTGRPSDRLADLEAWASSSPDLPTRTRDYHSHHFNSDKWDLVRVVTVSRVVFSESQPESEQW